jgi:hypothetical protein
VPVSVIRPDVRTHWPGWLRSIPYYLFAVAVSGGTIRISAEHTDFRWTRVEEARTLVRWENDRIALAALTAALTSH